MKCLHEKSNFIRLPLVLLATLLSIHCFRADDTDKYPHLNKFTSHMPVTRCMMYFSATNINKNRTTVFISASRLHKDFSNFLDTISKRRSLILLDMSTPDRERTIRRTYLNLGYTNIPRLGRLSFFVFYVQSLKELSDMVELLSVLYIFDPRAYFLVVLYVNSEEMEFSSLNPPEKIQHLYLVNAFNILWQKYIINSVVMFCFFFSTQCDMFTWFPYATQSKCATKTDTYHKLDWCDYDLVHNVLYVHYLNRSRILYETDIEHKDLVEPSRDRRAESIENKMKQKYYVRKFFDQVPTGIFEYRDTVNLDTQKYYYQKNSFKIYRYGHMHFFEKLPANYHGCIIKCVLFIWPPMVTAVSTPWIGLEHKMFLDISRFLNFKFKMIPVHSYLREDNDAVKLVYFANDTADVAFGNLYPVVEHNHLADYSIGYLYDSVIWVVPRAGLKPPWVNLFHVFSPLVWSIILVVFIFYTAIYTIINVRNTNRPYDAGIMDCVIAFLSSNISVVPQNQVVRFFLMLWILYSFHINLMYEVQLTTILTQPLRAKQISTPDEIVSQKIAFGYGKGFNIHFQRVNTTRAKYFLTHNQECNFRTCFNRTKSGKFATLANRLYITHALAFDNISADVFVLPEAVAKSFIHMYMKKGYPLRDQINFYIRRMIEIGYLSAAQKHYMQLTGNISSFRRDDKFREADFLNITHFTGAFIILLSGELIATIAFLFELFPSAREHARRCFVFFFHKHHRHNNNNNNTNAQ